jgi:membrane protein implicated in regulation of membrane protease activity
VTVDFSAATLWWLLAGALVASELLTGTIYLLALAVGAVGGAVAAHAGAGPTAQVVAAALIGGGATGLWHLHRRRHPRSAPAEANPDVNLDVGLTVQVEAWDPQGQARIRHRGADWNAIHVGPGAPQPGTHRVVAVRGNRLDLAAVAGSSGPQAMP